MSSSPTKSSINDNNLSPYNKNLRDRSRPSSRSSLRAHSPSLSLDDPVAVRTHISTIKHNIRQQKAQLNSLENIVRSGPRPYPADLSEEPLNMSASSSSLPPSSYVASGGATPTAVKRRSSHEVLSNLAGPESSLPLPRRDGLADESATVREGIPIQAPYKRASSPTKSRIPVSSVGNARALAEEGTSPRPTPSSSKLAPIDPDASSSSLQPPPSPNTKRYSLTPGGTTRVLADLQAGVMTAKTALENTKAQLRLSQRSVAQLTRQAEDYKDSRDRLRVENEGLNNVVARKERLLQEVLERARKAEADAALLKTQLKSETTTSKKTIREMEAALAESTALSSKSEREYITLRDSLKSMAEAWKQDTERLREEMRRREDKLQAEAQQLGKKYNALVQEIKNANEARAAVAEIKQEEYKLSAEVEKYWTSQIDLMRQRIEEEATGSEKANKTAAHLSEELARLRRLMQSVGRRSVDDSEYDNAHNLDPPP